MARRTRVDLGPEPRDAALDAAIVEDPEDPARYAVYADWLIERGDPRGELIHLSIAAAGATTKRARERLEAKVEKVRLREAGRFTGGSLAAHLANHDGYGGDPFVWGNGFIHTACLRCDTRRDQTLPADVLRDVLDHPSGRFLVELHLTREGEPRVDMQPAIDLLASRPPTLRELRMSESNLWAQYVHAGSFARAWPALAGVRELLLAGDFAFGDAIVLPSATTVSLASVGWRRAHADAIGNARWPALASLRIDLAMADDAVASRFVWALTQLPPSLRKLAVSNGGSAIRDAIERAVADRALEELALS